MSGNGWKRYAGAPLAVRATVALVITLAVLVIPALADQWVYARLHHAKIYDLDWAMALRATGTLYIWGPVALALWLVERQDDAALAKRRALLVVGSPALAGALCEVMKLLIRRERPEVGSGAWLFRDWSDRTFSTAGLATPSSHTMVAFGAATMMARLYPRARWVFYTMAWGCAATRVLARAHFLSDVTFGALLGWAVGWGVWMQWGQRQTEDRRPKTEDTNNTEGTAAPAPS